MRVFPLLFIAVPIVEMWLLIEVGGKIGAPSTIGLVFLTAILGLALLRRQGLETLMRAQQKMAYGEMPAKEMAEGIFLAAGGALLLTPGFITDALGFCCLIPGLRRGLIGTALKHVRFGTATGHYRQTGASTFEGEYQHDSAPRRPDVIEGQIIEREDPSNK